MVWLIIEINISLVHTVITYYSKINSWITYNFALGNTSIGGYIISN